MRHKFQIDSQKGLLKEEFIGQIELDLLTKSNTDIISHPTFKKRLNALTDLRNAQIPFGYDEMFNHVRSLPELHFSKHAFVVIEQREYGMLRMFLTLAQEKNIYGEAEIFQSIESAMEWLNV